MKIQVNARNRAHHFDAHPQDRILYAGLSKSIGLPYECGSGTCGTCKARLLSGEIEECWPDAPGRKYLKSADEFLMCQCTPLSDVSVEVASFVEELDPGLYVPAALKGKIVEATPLTHDVMQMRIALERPIDFDAGQFMLVRTPGIDGHRGWSMVNYERNAQVLTFVIKKKPGGKVSEWLFSMPAVGTDVDLFGPMGSATFYPAIARNILCIAGGSGIAGMMSILERARVEDYFSKFTGNVFFGVRTMDDAFYLEEFSRLRQACGVNLTVTVAFSEGEATADLQAAHPLLNFDTGYVHEVVGRCMQGRFQGVRAYLAGPPPAVEASVRMLLMARVSTDNIRYDKFS